MQSVRQIDFDELDAALRSAPALSARLFRKVLQDAHGSNPFASWAGWRHLMIWPRPGHGPTRRYACSSWNYRIGSSGTLFERATIGSVPYPANRICPLRSMTPWKGSTHRFRSPSCVRSSPRAGCFVPKSGRLCGSLKFPSCRVSLCAATILFDSILRRRIVNVPMPTL